MKNSDYLQLGSTKLGCSSLWATSTNYHSDTYLLGRKETRYILTLPKSTLSEPEEVLIPKLFLRLVVLQSDGDSVWKRYNLLGFELLLPLSTFG